MPIVEMTTRVIEKRETILAGTEECGFSSKSHRPLRTIYTLGSKKVQVRKLDNTAFDANGKTDSVPPHL